MNNWNDDNEERFAGMFRKAYGRDYREIRAINTNKNAQIADYDPHYTNEYYKTARVVWGVESKGLGWDYSDRLWQWDYEKAERASKEASKHHQTRTAAWVEKYLSVYFEKDIEIVCIMAGFNVSNGYPYQVFGYRERK